MPVCCQTVGVKGVLVFKNKLMFVLMTILLALIVFGCATNTVTQGEELPTIPLVAGTVVSVDGQVNPQKYAFVHQDERTGMTVYGQHDGENLYLALVSPGHGWVSAGFNQPGRQRMDGSSIVIGYVEDGIAYLQDHTGAEHGHNQKERPVVEVFAVIQDSEGTTMEFIYPFSSAGDTFLSPGHEFVLLVAYSKEVRDFKTYHSAARNSIPMVMGE